jgi:CubicO group peptidase (beta-lactamase class C family)
MNARRSSLYVCAVFALLVPAAPVASDRAHAQSNCKKPVATSTASAKGWVKDQPANVGLDEKSLLALDSDLAAGKYSLVDSVGVYRCGKVVFERNYDHDYGQIYGKEAKSRGPLNARLTGPYNYFDPAWHPYFHGTDLHSMQSVSKTVSSVILGIAKTRGDFKANLDTPLLHYFDVSKVKNVDDRKRRITLRHVLTMTTGLDWNEDNVPYDDPRSDSSRMEATDDWVQYVIDRPMAQEPGKVFNYSSGVSELLAYIFQKETGQDIEKYGAQFLFGPLGIDYYWKRTYLGVVDTEGGLYLKNSDLAKIGALYLHDGMWQHKQIVSKHWVKQSLTPFISAGDDYDYGLKWWLLRRKDRQGYIWMGRGFGGQRLMVFPEEQLVAVFTGWDLLHEPEANPELVSRLLTAVREPKCQVRPQ